MSIFQHAFTTRSRGRAHAPSGARPADFGRFAAFSGAAARSLAASALYAACRELARGARRAGWVAVLGGALAWAGSASAQDSDTQPGPRKETASAIADYNAGNYRAALEQFHDAAKRGDRLAQFDYAMMLVTGDGVAADVPEGLRWLKRAANAGMSHAQYVYGTMYDNGQFVERDPKEAHRWFLKAARQGHVQAELALANQFLDGRGTPRDNRQAFAWYKRAADAGDMTSQYVTASFYERGGDGVTPNINIARAYYAAAAAQGDEVAAIKFQVLSDRLKAQARSGAQPPHAQPQ